MGKYDAKYFATETCAYYFKEQSFPRTALQNHQENLSRKSYFFGLWNNDK